MSRFALLKELPNRTSSEARRDLLREVTENLSGRTGVPSPEESAELDRVMASVASEFSTQVRAEFAKLVAATPVHFIRTAEHFAMDEIEVAAPVLQHSEALSEEVLLKVVAEKSEAHMMALTQRSSVSPRLSHALVERGGDEVVSSLLSNEGADIADKTFDMVMERADASPLLQAGLVRRKSVPLDLLNELYLKTETGLRQEIMAKFGQVDPAELEKAFERSRIRLNSRYRQVPEDIAVARKNLAALEAKRPLAPASLAGLLREGAGTRTTFLLAFAKLADVEFEVIQRAVDGPDLDTLALLCRGSGFDRSLFVTLAVALDKSGGGLAKADVFAQLYEAVPVQAAQRAIRFWKIRTGG
ncbi:MAG TPA: DUF2336 domain-containing protein [Rhizomicrobium sp.]|nr:DUF2336 domain-containing protein [Rhizomicrobium sp.]